MLLYSDVDLVPLKLLNYFSKQSAHITLNVADEIGGMITRNSFLYILVDINETYNIEKNNHFV